MEGGYYFTHGASDLDHRCLKTRRSAGFVFLGGFHQVSLPHPQNPPPQKKLHFGRPFKAKTYYRDLSVSRTLITKLKLSSYIGIGKYLEVCQ